MDAHVGGEVFEKLFCGLWKDKTVVFFTNQLQYAKACDKVIVLAKGGVAQDGSFSDLIRTEGIFRDMMTNEVGADGHALAARNSEEKATVEGKIDRITVGKAVGGGGEVKEGGVKKLMQVEKKTVKRPTPFFMVTMARAVDAVWYAGGLRVEF